MAASTFAFLGALSYHLRCPATLLEGPCEDRGPESTWKEGRGPTLLTFQLSQFPSRLHRGPRHVIEATLDVLAPAAL